MSLLSVSTFSSLNSSVSEGSGLTVDLDATLLVQVVLFLLLLLILKPLLFEPMMRLFEEREKKIEGTRRDASNIIKRSAEALSKYNAAIAKAREAGVAERDVIRAEGARKEAEILAQVRALTATTIEQGRATIASDAKTTRADLEAQTHALGRQIAARVLGREVSP